MSDKIEHRKHKRYNLQLAIALVDEHGEHDRYHGKTKDISEGGCSILLEHNVHFSREVRILISLHSGTILEANGKNVYTVYSGLDQSFRMGIRFVSFKRSGHKKLVQYLASKVHYY